MNILSVSMLAALIATGATKSEAPSPTQSFGDVHFATSCKSDVQPLFDRGIALLHSFEFSEAEQSFGRVEAQDPDCVIAAWGVALAITQRSGAGAPPKDLARGWSLLKPWLALHPHTEREAMYVNAVRAMYEGYDSKSAQQRWHDYLLNMEQLRGKYPDDINAGLFYGLGLVWTAGPGEDGLNQRRKALAIFFPIFSKYPNNPGAAHYIIHAADTAELASEALPAARKYATIAPASPHALHMPSHIFNRLGLWTDSIDTNAASARVAADWIREGRDGTFDELHALNNLEYGHLQLGQNQAARQAINEIASVVTTDPWPPVDARIYYDLETHDWADALKTNPPASSEFKENFDVYWIRTIAASRTGDCKLAESALSDYTRSSALWEKDHGWGNVLSLARVEAEAWFLFCKGDSSEAVDKLRDSQKYERDHPLYYADVLPRPTGEMLGDMLLALHKSKEALSAYEEALGVAPRRLNSLRGAAAAAEAMGDAKTSEVFNQQIDEEMSSYSKPSR